MIAGPWGIRGHIKVVSLTENSGRFAPNSVLYFNGRPTVVTHARTDKRGVVLKLDVANDRTEADLLRGGLLTVPRNDVTPLPEGSYYHFQIIDIGVWTEEGEYLGQVKDILSTGSNDVYVVRDDDSKEVLVPALKSVIQDLSPERGRMVVRLPEGLR